MATFTITVDNAVGAEYLNAVEDVRPITTDEDGVKQYTQREWAEKLILDKAKGILLAYRERQAAATAVANVTPIGANDITIG